MLRGEVRGRSASGKRRRSSSAHACPALPRGAAGAVSAGRRDASVAVVALVDGARGMSVLAGAGHRGNRGRSDGPGDAKRRAGGIDRGRTAYFRLLTRRLACQCAYLSAHGRACRGSEQGHTVSRLSSRTVILAIRERGVLRGQLTRNECKADADATFIQHG